jgi:hypothetical protein
MSPTERIAHIETDVEGIAATNPLVDQEQFREGARLLKELREHGQMGPTYGIASPQSGRLVQEPRRQ